MPGGYAELAGVVRAARDAVPEFAGWLINGVPSDRAEFELLAP